MDEAANRQASALAADCERCAGLCCVALAFDRSAWFAFDKPGGVPCQHLTATNQCGIHARLARRGFAGCASYTCWGAGQRVTQELFRGRSWREHPALAVQMFDAFRALREVHELLRLLQAARRLPLTATELQQLDAFASELEPRPSWTLALLAAFERSQLAPAIRNFFSSLRTQLPDEGECRRRLRVVPAAPPT